MFFLRLCKTFGMCVQKRVSHFVSVTIFKNSLILCNKHKKYIDTGAEAPSKGEAKNFA
jgi:hypothetical protein